MSNKKSQPENLSATIDKAIKIILDDVGYGVDDLGKEAQAALNALRARR